MLLLPGDGFMWVEAMPEIKSTLEQEAVIETWGQGLAVVAGAGCGKTTTLVAKCARLLELNPDARFIAVSFTERSAGDLKEKLSELFTRKGMLSLLQPQWVMTIHGLCAALIRERGGDSSFFEFSGEETLLSESESQNLWNQTIESLWITPLPEWIQKHLQCLYERETQESLFEIFSQIKDRAFFGVKEALSASIDPYWKALDQVSTYLLENYRKLKWSQASLDFQDLEKGAESILSDPSVSASMHKKWDLILVDEFQDTNLVQARLIEKLARPHLSNLCIVGDPKQSIYRFRDADVSLFEDFCLRLPARLFLTRNFRSLPPIIDFVNHIGPALFANSPIPYEPLVAERPSTGSAALLRLQVQDPMELGTWICAQHAQGVPFSEMVLLTRKIRGHEKWFQALRAAGIPLVFGAGGFFWEDPRVRELVAFLRWIHQPAHTLSGAIFLRAPWMEISDVELDTWVQEDPTFFKPFFNSTHRIAKQLRPFLRLPLRPGEWLLKLLEDSNLELELTVPLLGLWHRVEELSSRWMNAHEVMDELSCALEQKRRDREVPMPIPTASHLSSDPGALSVLTLHGAKGLEFSQVILLDFGDAPRSADTPLLFWDRSVGVFLGQRDPQTGERVMNAPDEKQWKAAEKQKALEESKRLFYVGLTRARNRLIFVCPTLKKIKKNSIVATTTDPENVFEKEDWRAWLEYAGKSIPMVMASDSFEGVVQDQCQTGGKPIKIRNPLEHFKSPEAKGHFAVPTFTQPPQMRSRHSITEWVLLRRCPRAYEWTYLRPKISKKSHPYNAPQTQSAEPSLDPSANSTPDSLALLQQAFIRGDGKLAQAFAKQRLEQMGRGVDDSFEKSWQWFSELPQLRPMGDYPGIRIWTEMSFEVPIQKQVLLGRVHRMVRTQRQGKPLVSLFAFHVSEATQSQWGVIRAHQSSLEIQAAAMRYLDADLAKTESIRCYVVQLTLESPFSIRVLPVPTRPFQVEEVLQSAVQLIQGASGQPCPSNGCRRCQVREHCPEGQKRLQEMI